MLNPYEKMRDPFEAKRPFFRSAASWGDDSDGQERLFWLLHAQVAKSRDAMRLLSLTRGDDRPGSELEKPFRCPWARARMWEQYAEDHAGVCLIFDRVEMLRAVSRSLGTRGSYRKGEVRYTVAGFADSAATRITLSDFAEYSLEDDVRHHVVKHYKDFFFLKTDDWASEFEYRFVFEEAVGRAG